MARIDLVSEDAEDPALASIFARVRRGDRPVPDLYRALGNAPAMLTAWTAMAWPLRTEATTSRALRELVIMRVAVVTRAAFEWEAHWPAALAAGVRVTQLHELDAWDRSEQFSDAERAALRCVDEMTSDGAASEEAIAGLRAHFDDGELVELVLTAAFYTCVSKVLRSLGIEPTARDGDEAGAVFAALTDGR